MSYKLRKKNSEEFKNNMKEKIEAYAKKLINSKYS